MSDNGSEISMSDIFIFTMGATKLCYTAQK